MTQPNLVFIIADDLGWRDLGCYGSSFYETPHLDLLARRGLRFTDAYATCPVCSPTRASVLSGKYPARVGVTDWIGAHTQGRLIDVPYSDHLPHSETSLAAALGAGGYATWHVGKWHLGGEGSLPTDHGFDENIGGCGWGMPKRGYQAPWGIPTVADAADGTWLDDHLTSQAIRLIEERDADRPFFLHMSFYLVHTPLQAKPELIEKYRTKRRMLGLEGQKEVEIGEAFPCEHKQHQRLSRRLFQGDPIYAAMVQQMDDNVGRLVTALEQAGILDDTVIVFTSDNGGLATAEGHPTCNAPLSEGKGWMYEGGVREPLIVHGPGRVTADTTCEEPVTLTDVYPTFLDLAGLPGRPEQHVDGVSIVPLLADPAGALERDAIFWHYPHYGNQGGTPACSVRMGDYKLIRFFEDGHHELYNLRRDVSEDHDLAAECPDRVQAMAARLDTWIQDVEAKIPQPNPDFAPWPNLKPLREVDPAWV